MSGVSRREDFIFFKRALLLREAAVMPRKIVVHVFRHGKAAQGILTPEGIRELKGIGKELRKSIPRKGSAKFYFSPVPRAVQTAGILREATGKKALKYVPRTREALTETGRASQEAFLKEFEKAGKNESVLLSRWLDKAIDASVLEQPEKSVERLKKALFKFPAYLSGRLKEGKPIHLVYVSHGGPLDAFIEHLTNAKMSDLGGFIKNGERMIFTFKKGSLSLVFRGKKYGLY